MTSFDSVESLREFFRQRVERSSLRAVADDAGLNHQSVANFVNGVTKRPSGDVLEAMRAYAERIVRESAPAGVGRAAPATPVELLPGYWIGRVREIGDAFEATLARLRAFEAAGERWEVGSALARAAPAPGTPKSGRPPQAEIDRSMEKLHTRAARRRPKPKEKGG